MSDRELRRLLGRRLPRRAVVRGAAAAGLATGITSLAGCTSPAAVVPSPAAVATSAPAAGATGPTPSPTPVQAKLGGKFIESFQGEAPNLDPHMVSQIGSHVFGLGIAYSKLLQYRTDVSPADRVPTGDLAESWTQP